MQAISGLFAFLSLKEIASIYWKEAWDSDLGFEGGDGEKWLTRGKTERLDVVWKVGL